MILLNRASRLHLLGIPSVLTRSPRVGWFTKLGAVSIFGVVFPEKRHNTHFIPRRCTRWRRAHTGIPSFQQTICDVQFLYCILHPRQDFRTFQRSCPVKLRVVVWRKIDRGAPSVFSSSTGVWSRNPSFLPCTAYTHGPGREWGVWVHVMSLPESSVMVSRTADM